MLPLTVERLAKAGLYYLPDAKIEDRTVCYACGKALHTWAPTDDPLYEHCQINPDCSHIQVRVAPNFTDLQQRARLATSPALPLRAVKELDRCAHVQPCRQGM